MEFFHLDEQLRKQDEKVHDPDNKKHDRFVINTIKRIMIKSRKLDKELVDKFYKIL